MKNKPNQMNKQKKSNVIEQKDEFIKYNYHKVNC